MHKQRHEGKVALVTGAAQGIGLAITRRLAKDGARVVAVDRNPDLLTMATEGITGVSAIVGDVGTQAGCRQAIEKTLELHGVLDVVSAHAGIARSQPFLELDEHSWREHMAVNVEGVLWCAVHAARAMVAAGRPGSIVITASINAFHVEESMTSYNVSKGALNTLIRSAAMDLGAHGIRVNGVAPGVVDTPIAEFVVHDDILGPAYLRTIPLGRFGQPDEIGDVVSWLASSEARYVTGQTIVIDGGQTLGITGNLATTGKDGE